MFRLGKVVQVAFRYGSCVELCRVALRQGMFGFGSQGWSVRVSAWSVALWQSWFVRFRHGTASWVTAVAVGCGAVRSGTVRSGIVRQFWFVRFRSVAVCSGVVRQLGPGWARQGMAWYGKVRQGSYGLVREVRLGVARHVPARQLR